MSKKVFINVPVKNLDVTMDFFRKLGYTYNMQFTNEMAACMVISDDIYVMQLTEPFFQGFTRKELPDTSKSSEVIVALTVDSREAVDAFMEKAIAAGATTPMEKQDHGWMYSHGFQCPDGHLWEVFWMDPTAATQNQVQEAATA